MKEIIEIVKSAGNILLEYHNKRYNINYKSKDNSSPVTEADIKSSQYITQKIIELYPKDQILSEEQINNVDYSKRIWIIDPLDGTDNFILGKDGFSIAVGLCVDGKPIFGVVFLPKKNELYVGEYNKGSYLEINGKKQVLNVSRISELADARLFIKPIKDKIRPFDLIISVLKVKERMEGDSMAARICHIALGKADLYIHPSKKNGKWDTCASEIILTEAGGIVTDINGKRLNYAQESDFWEDSIVASNGLIHSEVIGEINRIKKEKGKLALN